VHALLVSESTIRAIAASGVSVETQPAFLEVLGASYARVLDPARLRRLIPLRQLLDAGVVVGLGSDWPTCPPSVALGIGAACGRMSPNGVADGAFGSVERVSILEALRMYTLLGARSVGVDADAGSIEPGKYADFSIWEQDLPRLEAPHLAELAPVA